MFSKIKIMTALLLIITLAPLKSGKRKLSNQQKLRQTYSKIGIDAEYYISAINAVVNNISYSVNYNLAIRAVLEGIPRWMKSATDPAFLTNSIRKHIAEIRIIDQRTQTLKIHNKVKLRKVVYKIVANVIRDIIPDLQASVAQEIQSQYRDAIERKELRAAVRIQSWYRRKIREKEELEAQQLAAQGWTLVEEDEEYLAASMDYVNIHTRTQDK